MMYTNVDDASVQAFDFNIVGSIPAPGPNMFLHGVAQDANREIYYLLSNGNVLKLQPEFPIPEPSTIALAALGAVGVWRSRRR